MYGDNLTDYSSGRMWNADLGASSSSRGPASGQLGPARVPGLRRPASEAPGEVRAPGALCPAGGMSVPGLPPEDLGKEDMVMSTAQRRATAVVTAVPHGSLLTPLTVFTPYGSL